MVNVKSHTRKTKKGQVRVKTHTRSKVGEKKYGSFAELASERKWGVPLSESEKTKLRDFISQAHLEIRTVDGKIIDVGLKWGESKRMTRFGFSRKEQIRFLDYLSRHPKTAMSLIKSKKVN